MLRFNGLRPLRHLSHQDAPERDILLNIQIIRTAVWLIVVLTIAVSPKIKLLWPHTVCSPFWSLIKQDSALLSSLPYTIKVTWTSNVEKIFCYKLTLKNICCIWRVVNVTGVFVQCCVVTCFTHNPSPIFSLVIFSTYFSTLSIPFLL